MAQKSFSVMDIETAVDRVDAPSRRIHDLWPLDEVDPKKTRFPCCIVWTPLPIVSWLVPYFGHVGICREDGTVLDFAGSCFVSADNFAYGTVARYLQLDREQTNQLVSVDNTGQCCFPPNIAGHSCVQGRRHAERGTALSWDEALHSSTQRFQHKYYNLFTCNCHSFVANCLNRLAYERSLGWNIVNLAALILWKGRWVDGMSVFRSFFPFAAVLCFGILMAGWPFLIGMLTFSFLVMGWFLLGTYCAKNLMC